MCKNKGCGACSSGCTCNIERIPGIKGNDGYTPQKGVDYFDGVPGNDGKHGRGTARFQQPTEPTLQDYQDKYGNVLGFGINPAESNALNPAIGDAWAIA